MSQAKLAVITVSYHTGDVLFECIDAVLSSNATEMIVIDNGNPPEVRTALESLAAETPRFRVYSEDNIGFSKACNLGASLTKCEYLLFLNPDVVAEANAIETLFTAYKAEREQTRSDKLIFSGMLLESGAEARGLRRNILTPVSLFLDYFPLTRRFPILKQKAFNIKTSIPDDALIEVPVISGALMLLSDSFFRALKGFDEGYFLHVEDVDFCRRVNEAGGQIVLFQNACFTHQRSSSDVASHVVNQHKINSFVYYFKTHHKLFWYSPLGILLYVLIWLKYKWIPAIFDKDRG